MSWNFAKTEDKTNQGTTLMAFESFKGDDKGSLIREIIQNSLDAKRVECEKVILEVEFGEVCNEEFPGKKELQRTLEACQKQFEDAEKDKKVLKDMLDMFGQQSAPIVTFRDKNTTGLLGDINNDKSDLSLLIYGDGTTGKDSKKSSGGSFGIGKNAPFTKAGIRTIFYETKTVDGNYTCVGKSILTSHTIEGKRRVPRGYFVDVNIENYIKKNKLSECGTAVHIPFYKFRKNKENEKNLFVRDVLKNFLVSIYEGNLEVNIIDDHSEKISIRKETLNKLCRKLKGKNSIERTIVSQYDLLENPKTIKKKVSIDECNYIDLYVLVNDLQNSQNVYYNMREQLMMICEKKLKVNNNLYKYSALAIYRGVKLNRILKEAEPPEHDKWLKQNIIEKEDKKYFDNAINNVEKEIVNNFTIEENEFIVLKEFNNNIFTTQKETQDYFKIREIGERRKVVKKQDANGLKKIDGGFINGSNNIKDKSNPKDKAVLSSTGTMINYIELPDIIKKVRKLDENRYKFILSERIDPKNSKLRFYITQDDGKTHDIFNCKIVFNDGEIIIAETKEQLELGLSVEVKNEATIK